MRMTTLEFILKGTEIHENKYDYSRVDCKGNKIKVEVVCPKHGSFFTSPNNHILLKRGCPKCGRDRVAKTLSMSTELFIEKAKAIHGNFYDYSKVDYKNSVTPITVICPVHGEFLQRPCSHLNGSHCPKCKRSKGEIMVSRILDEYNISYESEYLVRDRIFKSRKTRQIFVDFVVHSNGKIFFIEYNGKQHYVPVKYFGGLLQYQQLCNRDRELRLYCSENNITLIEITYQDSYDVILQKLNVLRQ